MNREALESLDKATLIDLVLARADAIAKQGQQIVALSARVYEKTAGNFLPVCISSAPSLGSNDDTP